MNDEKRRLRDEVAELSEAVRELRQQLASQHHCHCYYVPVPNYTVTHYPYYPIYPPYNVGYGNTATGNISIGAP